MSVTASSKMTEEFIEAVFGKTGMGAKADPDAGKKLARASAEIKTARASQVKAIERAASAVGALERNIRVLERVRLAVLDESRGRQSVAEMIEALVDKAKADLVKVGS